MRILGIDPGTDRLGYGVIDVMGRDITYVAAGVIQSKSKDNQTMLTSIYDDIMTVIEQFQPDEVSVELIVRVMNQIMIRVVEARGAVIIAVSKSQRRMTSYNPMTIKKVIAGNGRADKKQMQQSVSAILGLDYIIKPDDAADALAIAITHAYSR